jgi:hypothetical protein
LTDGAKIGDVWRLTAGTFNTNNSNKNLLVTALTATVMTVAVLNGTTLTTEGPIASATLTCPGKKTLAPLTGHTAEYWTVEDWYGDITQSELFTDVMFGQAQIALPANGNATIDLAGAGRNRVLSQTQVLTSPTAETTTDVLTAVQGLLIVNGAVVSNVTGIQINIDGKVAPMEGVVGSLIVPDVQRSTIEVSGQFTAFFQDATISTTFDNATTINLIAVLASNSLANADFMTFNIPMINVTGDNVDDGLKGLVRTYPFTAKINSAGGAALATDQTIISIQDSRA